MTTTERIADDNGDELEHGEPDFPGQFPATTVSLGSCPTCEGPAQFIDDCGKGGDCDCQSVIRHVALPNIDEDLGDGWRLSGLEWFPRSGGPGIWTARAWRPGASPGAFYEEAAGDTASQAYLALRSAIEARR